MWIIIEGSTCSGKSTLEKELSRKLEAMDEPLEKVHMDRPAELTRRWVLNEYAMRWETHRPVTTNVLADRWHWGEPVYGPIYRPDTDKDGFGLLGVAGWRWVELFLQSRGALTVLLRADDSTLISRYQRRGDDHVTGTSELLQVAKAYDSVFPYAPSATLVWDTTQANMERTSTFANTVLQAAEIHQRNTAPLRRYRGYIGRPQPHALLVGDKRNVTRRYGDETKLPFMPVNGNSGDYLLRALPEDWWPGVGIVNSDEYPHSLSALWSDLNQPPVVALGANAEKALKRQGVPCARVHHPQYARRFQHADIDAYGQSIKAAAERQEK